MNEPQVWTLIGVFAAGLFGMITLMSTMFVRIIRTEIQGGARPGYAYLRHHSYMITAPAALALIDLVDPY